MMTEEEGGGGKSNNQRGALDKGPSRGEGGEALHRDSMKPRGGGGVGAATDGAQTKEKGRGRSLLALA